MQAYAKKFTEYAGEHFGFPAPRPIAQHHDRSLVSRPNGDVVRLDWRVADAGGLRSPI